MSGGYFMAFAVTFVAGPLLFVVFTRIRAGLWLTGLVGVLVAGAVAGALGAAGGVVSTGPFDASLVSLLWLWLAWVLAIILVALALRRRSETSSARRWISILGLLATTLPWFGLATARMMVH